MVGCFRCLTILRRLEDDLPTVQNRPATSLTGARLFKFILQSILAAIEDVLPASSVFFLRTFVYLTQANLIVKKETSTQDAIEISLLQIIENKSKTSTKR